MPWARPGVAGRARPRIPVAELDFPRSLRVQQDLGVAVDPLVELLVGAGCLSQSDLVRDDPGRGGLPGDDQITQLLVIALDPTMPMPPVLRTALTRLSSTIAGCSWPVWSWAW